MSGIETIFASPWQLLAAFLIVIAIEIVYLLLGFGAGLVALGALAVLPTDFRDLAMVLLLVNLPAELWVVATSWRKVAWRGVGLIMAGIGTGIPVGAWLLRQGDTTVLMATFGAMLILSGAALGLAPLGGRIDWPRWAAAPVGVLSGLLAGLFGAGSPPLVIYYQLSDVNKAAFRGTLMAIFLLMTVVRAPVFTWMGLITIGHLWSSLLLLPAALVGAWIGNRLHIRVTEETFRHLVALALVALGLVLFLW